MYPDDYEAGKAAPDIKTLNGIVFNILYLNERWWTPFELIAHIKARYWTLISDSSCTARLRDLRKAKYGAHNIEKRRREG